MSTRYVWGKYDTDEEIIADGSNRYLNNSYFRFTGRLTNWNPLTAYITIGDTWSTTSNERQYVVSGTKTYYETETAFSVEAGKFIQISSSSSGGSYTIWYTNEAQEFVFKPEDGLYVTGDPNSANLQEYYTGRKTVKGDFIASVSGPSQGPYPSCAPAVSGPG